MKRADTLIIKSVTVLIYSTLALMVLFSLLVLVVPLLLNPNHYKAQIVDRVLEKTGRSLTFAGDIEWSLFPDPALTLPPLTLSNAPGFGSGPMLRIQRLHGKLNLRKLLKWQFALEQPVLTGVELLLESDAAGRSNWDDLVTRMAVARAEGVAQTDDLPDNVAKYRQADEKLSLAQLGVWALASLSARSVTLQEGMVRLCRPGGTEAQAVSCLQATHLVFTPQSDQTDRRPAVQLQADLAVQEPPFVGRVSLLYRQPPWTDRAVTQWRDTEITVRGQVNLPPAKELELVWRSDVTMGPEPHNLHITQADSRLTVWSDTALFREFTLTMKENAEADLRTGKLSFPQGGVTWRVKSDQLPPAGVEWAFHSPIELDWRQETVHMAALRVHGPAQSRMEGRLRGERLLSRPSIDAELTSVRFEPRALLVAMGRSVSASADPAALQRGEGSAVIHLDAQSLEITRLVLELDDTRLVGNLHWQTDAQTDTGRTVIRFDLQGDRLDLDRYLPVDLTDPTRAGVVAQALLAPEWLLTELPPHWLHNLALQGRLTLGELRTASGRATDLALTVGVQDRQLQWQPYQLTIHDGRVESRVLWDDRGAEPVLTVDKTATDLQVEPLLHSVANLRWLTGRVNGVAHLSSQGRSPDLLWKNLNGTLALMVRDGAMQGMDLAERFREGYAGGQEQRPGQAPSSSALSGAHKTVADRRGNTPFTRLTATGQVTGGVLGNQDLLLLSPLLQVTGKGSVDLTRAAVDYTLEVDGLAAVRGSGTGAEGQRLVLPMRLQGDLNALKGPTVGALRPPAPAQ
ncbi:MAG: AsmA family protein [Magnetococcus sp. DMHC-8]